jgi:hypothetical protein
MQNRLIQTSQTGGQWYSDTSPLVFPGLFIVNDEIENIYRTVTMTTEARVYLASLFFCGSNVVKLFRPVIY